MRNKILDEPKDEPIGLSALKECSVVLEKIEDESCVDELESISGRPFAIVIEKLTDDEINKYLHKCENYSETVPLRKVRTKVKYPCMARNFRPYKSLNCMH